MTAAALRAAIERLRHRGPVVLPGLSSLDDVYEFAREHAAEQDHGMRMEDNRFDHAFGTGGGWDLAGHGEEYGTFVVEAVLADDWTEHDVREYMSELVEHGGAIAGTLDDEYGEAYAEYDVTLTLLSVTLTGPRLLTTWEWGTE